MEIDVSMTLKSFLFVPSEDCFVPLGVANLTIRNPRFKQLLASYAVGFSSDEVRGFSDALLNDRPLF